MPQSIDLGMRSTAHQYLDNTYVRRVDLFEKGLMLEPNINRWITFLMGIKADRGAGTGIPTQVIEWPEKRFMDRWVLNGGAAALAGDTSLALAAGYGPLVTPNTILVVPPSASSTGVPEIIRVNTTAGDNLTSVTRGMGSTTAAGIAAGASLFICNTAYAEGAAAGQSQSWRPTFLKSYLEIFRRSIKTTESQRATKQYGTNGMTWFDHQKMLTLQELKRDLNHAFLFSKGMEDVTNSQQPFRLTQGVIPSIQSNIINVGGALTSDIFFSQMSTIFRYGSPEKVMLCAPIYLDAVNKWVRSAVTPINYKNITEYGVRILQVETGHGVLKLMKDELLMDRIPGTNSWNHRAFVLDMKEIDVYHLAGNGVNRNLHLREDIVRDGSDARTDEYLCEMGIQVRNETTHAAFVNTTSFS